ncbi:MAG: hypothetical protein GXO62_02535 [Epsilonproteobacteria bacterium]|nr:hypothetical protein [Campylobacterota bacterium]
MGFWSSLSSFVSKAVSVVVDTVKSVGTRVVESATQFLKAGARFLDTVSTVIEGIAKKLGLIEINDNAEDLGDRAMRADKKMEDFESVNEYIDYLKNKISSTPKDQLENLPAHERFARKAVGNAILSKALEEKLKMEIPVDFWVEAVKAGLSGREIDEMLKRFKLQGIKPQDFAKYLKKELNEKEEEKMDKFLIQAFKEIEPNMSEEDIEEKVYDLQRR